MVKRHRSLTASTLATLGAMAVFGAAEVSAAPVTNITVRNTRTSGVNLTSTNVSGYLNPLPPSTIAAGGSATFGSYSSGTADAGIIYYGGCRFNWSKIQSSGIWTFSIGATPSTTCAGAATLQDPFTGAYSLTFTTK